MSGEPVHSMDGDVASSRYQHAFRRSVANCGLWMTRPPRAFKIRKLREIDAIDISAKISGSNSLLPRLSFSWIAQITTSSKLLSSMAPLSLPINVHVSTHPCLRAKLSLLRSKDANARDTKALVHEIALIVSCEALATCLKTTTSGTVRL